MTDDDPIALAAGVRPQTFGRARPERVDRPVVEPHWLGLRVIVAVAQSGAAMFDAGAPLEGHERILSRLTAMIARTADGVILDGYLTKQLSADDLPARILTDSVPTAAQLMTKPFIGIRRNRAEERIRRLDAEEAARVFADHDIVNLVLTDLLWLDGEWLLDVPLLERKRLLEAVIPGDDLVRAGPYVLPPYERWIGSWRAQGFNGITFKAANSRYRPGEPSDDWAQSDLPRR
jgi:ATP dependent DNA ligase domain